MEKRKGRAQDRLAAAADAYLQAHSEEKFSLETMAGALYVNGSYLLRAYKSATGNTLLYAHNRVRCEKAMRLLDEDAKSISEVGEAVGFASSSHFSHIFKKMTGMTPSEYRDRKR